MKEHVPSSENLPPWVVDVRNSYKIMRGVSDEGPAILGVGPYERPGGGKIEHEETFDIREAFFAFLKKCKRNVLPEAIPLDAGYHGPEQAVELSYTYRGKTGSVPLNLRERRPSEYFLPSTGEKYSIVESSQNHPELYPDSPDFIGFEKLKRNEVGVPVTSRGAAHIMGSGVGFDSVYPTVSKDDFVEMKFGEVLEALEKDQIETIIAGLRKEIKDDETLKLLDGLESKIAITERTTEEKIVNERSRISNDIQRRAKNFVAILKEAGGVTMPKEMEIGGSIQDGFFKFLPEENRLMKSGTDKPVEFYQKQIAEFEKKKDEKIELPSGKTITYQDLISDIKKDIEKTKLTEATEEDWVIWGTRVASVLADLLPEKIKSVVMKWPLVD
jgi:hypothetical protein